MPDVQNELERVSSLIQGESPTDLERSRAVCREITSRAGSSFAVGIRLTPSRCRPDMHALYAWMRLADDAADALAPAEQRRLVLDRFAASTESVLAGESPSRGIWPALSHSIGSCGIKPEWFRSLLDGVRQDLEPIAFEHDSELVQYCDRVAGNVGRCCVAIWGVRSGVVPADAFELAGQRGRAFQLINVARDIGDDERAGRRYVPIERLGRLGADIGDPAVRQDLLREAHDLLESSAPLDAMVRRDAGPAMWAMTRAYTLIAHRLRMAGAGGALGGGAKLGIAVGALGRRVLAAGRLA
ncbi:MAG: phytoene/squalene synthase family protein [Phycisphaerales bacterium]